jgi:hypothetical protein
MSSSGFYVSPTGNDKNAGTLNAPFLTLAKAQQAMRAAPVADRTAYLLSGTYTVTSPIVLSAQDNGETWTTYPGAAAHSAVLVNGSSDSEIFDIYDKTSVQNLTFSNLTFDGGSSGGNAVFIGGNGNNIHVQNNVFRNHFNGSDLYIYNSDNVYFQGNTSGPNELQPVSGHVTDGKVHSGLFVTDNNLSGFNRIGVELQQNSAGYFQNVHLDRNVVKISARGNSAGNMVFSFVAGPSSVGNTVWGNTVTGVRGNNQAFLELGSNNTSVEHNSVSQIDWGVSFSSARGSEVENNTFTNDGPAFSKGGAYNDSQWVGVNTINGVSQTGWSGVPNATAKPVVWSQSAAAGVVSTPPIVASDPPPPVVPNLKPTVAIAGGGGTVTSAVVTIKGTVDVADAGSTVTILGGAAKIGSAKVSAAGSWSASVTLPKAGANLLTATDTNAAGMGTSKALTYTLIATAPILTIRNSTVHVTAGGSANLGLSVAAPGGATNTTVTLSGLPSYEKIVDNLDHRTFSGGVIKLTQAEVNSGLNIESFYTGVGKPSATLTITASDTIGGVGKTSAAKTITVIDPPASSTLAASNTPSSAELLFGHASPAQTIANLTSPAMGIGDDKFALASPEWASFAALLGGDHNTGAYSATGTTHGEDQQLLGFHVAALAGSKADSKLHG